MPKLSACAGTRAHSMSTWSALDLAEQRSPCRDAERQRAAPAIIVNQNRGSSHVYHAEIACICASFPPRIHAFGKPPYMQPSYNGQRSSGNVILRAVHFYRVYLMYLIKMHPQVCGLCCLLAGKWFFDAPAHVCAHCTCIDLEGFRARA